MKDQHIVQLNPIINRLFLWKSYLFPSQIDFGQPNESFNFEGRIIFNVQELISFVNDYPRWCRWRLAPTEALAEHISMNSIDLNFVEKVSNKRMRQPLLFADTPDGFRLIDGNHRLKKRINEGKKFSSIVMVPWAAVRQNVILLQDDPNWSQKL